MTANVAIAQLYLPSLRRTDNAIRQAHLLFTIHSDFPADEVA